MWNARILRPDRSRNSWTRIDRPEVGRPVGKVAARYFGNIHQNARGRSHLCEPPTSMYSDGPRTPRRIGRLRQSDPQIFHHSAVHDSRARRQRGVSGGPSQSHRSERGGFSVYVLVDMWSAKGLVVSGPARELGSLRFPGSLFKSHILVSAAISDEALARRRAGRTRLRRGDDRPRLHSAPRDIHARRKPGMAPGQARVDPGSSGRERRNHRVPDARDAKPRVLLRSGGEARTRRRSRSFSVAPLKCFS